MSTTVTIGIVGTGRFASVLRNLFELDTKTFSIKQSSTTKSVNYKTIFPLEEVLLTDLIFLSIPISVLEKFLGTHSNLFKNKKSVVVEVCSVNSSPTKWLSSALHSHPNLISSHPIFGKDSSFNGTNFKNLPFVIWPIKLKNVAVFETLIKHLKTQGVNIIKMSPEDHDAIQAKTLSVAFLFGKLGSFLKLEPTNLDTPGFKHLLANQHLVEKDSNQLFKDLFTFNPSAKQTLAQTSKLIKKIQKETASKSTKSLQSSSQ